MTIQERLEIYQEMLKRISNIQDMVICLCGTLNIIYADRARKLDWKSKPENFSNKIEDYPELMELKPKDLSGIYWWDRNSPQPRIECLKQAIIACESNIIHPM